MPTLYEALTWRYLPLSGTAAAPNITFGYGEVGSGNASGPSALLISGTHGDEGPWSALAIKTFLAHPLSCLQGQLRVVFTANPLAAQANTRNAPIDSPNVLDLDAVFPGNPNGSHTERIAAQLAPLVAQSDIVIDLHGGGSWCVNAFTKTFSGSEGLAEAIAAPFHREAPNKAGGLTTYARAQGAKVINVEVGGRGSTERDWERFIADGLARALNAEGVISLDAPPALPTPGIPTGPTQVLRSSAAGIFVPSVSDRDVGATVPKDTELGKVLDLITLTELEVLRAPFETTALMLLRPQICVVEAGALLYALAEPEGSNA